MQWGGSPAACHQKLQAPSSFLLQGVSVIIISWFTSPLLAGLGGAILFLFTRHAGEARSGTKLPARSTAACMAALVTRHTESAWLNAVSSAS